MRAAWLLLVLVGATALAEAPPAWTPLAESEATAYYYDASTVRGEGARRRVWRLFEHRRKAADGVQSGKALIEVDCKEWTFRYVRTLYYGGRMGHGPYLGGSGEQPPDHIGPGSMVGLLARAVCNGSR